MTYHNFKHLQLISLLWLLCGSLLPFIAYYKVLLLSTTWFIPTSVTLLSIFTILYLGIAFYQEWNGFVYSLFSQTDQRVLRISVALIITVFLAGPTTYLLGLGAYVSVFPAFFLPLMASLLGVVLLVHTLLSVRNFNRVTADTMSLPLKSQAVFTESQQLDHQETVDSSLSASAGSSSPKLLVLDVEGTIIAGYNWTLPGKDDQTYYAPIISSELADTLRVLKDMGFTIVIATGTDRDNLIFYQHCFQQHGLAPYITSFQPITHDREDGKVDKLKKYYQQYHIVDKYEHMVFYDDGPGNVQTAQEAGFQAYLVTDSSPLVEQLKTLVQSHRMVCQK